MSAEYDLQHSPFSPINQPEFSNNYVYRLRFDGDVLEETFNTYEDAVNDLKEWINKKVQFDICIIEQFEVDLHEVAVFYTLDKNEYIQKVWRFIELESAQWELSSDELVEKNQLKYYLNFKL
jgi:hypothetical protein